MLNVEKLWDEYSQVLPLTHTHTHTLLLHPVLAGLREIGVGDEGDKGGQGRQVRETREASACGEGDEGRQVWRRVVEVIA